MNTPTREQSTLFLPRDKTPALFILVSWTLWLHGLDGACFPLSVLISPGMMPWSAWTCSFCQVPPVQCPTTYLIFPLFGVLNVVSGFPDKAAMNTLVPWLHFWPYTVPYRCIELDLFYGAFRWPRDVLVFPHLCRYYWLIYLLQGAVFARGWIWWLTALTRTSWVSVTLSKKSHSGRPSPTS